MLLLDDKADDVRDQFVEIPVEIPAQVVVHQAAIQIGSNVLRLGSPVDASLEINSSLSWFREVIPPGLQFTYDIEVDDHCWIMVGKRHGTFSAEDVVEIKIKLIPLRTGLLLYPSIDIKSFDDAILSETHLVSNNMEALVIGKDSECAVQF